MHPLYFNFPSLKIEQALDHELLPLGFVKAARSVVPHANYSQKVDNAIFIVSLVIEVAGCNLTELPLAVIENPPVSVVVILADTEQLARVELPICVNVSHHRALGMQSFIRPTLHWIKQLYDTGGFLDFIAKNPSETCSITGYRFLKLKPLFEQQPE